MKVGSLFAGIDGFGLGFERAGMTCTWQVEIDPFARKVLSRHWPNVQRYEDVREVGGQNLAVVDVICGGFPCQDLSIAGRRKGLAGNRSGLFFQMARILRELQPTWVVIENVDGLLSSHFGTDFGLVLRELEDVGYVAGAWRVLDSRWFGVPQRRNRVFIVGCLRGSGRRPEAVLFESARSAWDSPPRREARARIANGARDGVAFALRQGPGGIGQGHNTNYVAETASTLRGRSHGQGINAPGRGGEDDANLITAHALASSRTRTGRLDPSGETFVAAVAPTLSSSGAGTSRTGNDRTEAEFLIASTLTASAGHHGRSSPRGDGQDNLVVGSLMAKSQGGWRCGADEAGAGHIVPVDELVTYAIGSHAGAADGVQTNASHGRGGPVGMGIQEEMANTLRAGSASRIGGVSAGVRRLTPLECERLQGFPDGWTCLCGCEPYSTLACRCKDGPRYRVLGNAVTVPVIEWIGRRLVAEDVRARAGQEESIA